MIGRQPLLGHLQSLRRIATGRWQYPLAPRHPVVLLYHGVSALDSALDMHVNTFAEHMRFLAKHYRVIDWRESGSRDAFERPSVVLTFDDGFRNNLDVAAPILSSLRFPAVFFVCTRHTEPGRPLWFRHLQLIERFFPGNSLRFDGRVFDLSPGARARSMGALRTMLLDLRPHPHAMYEALDLLPAPGSFISPADQADRCEGLRPADIAELGSESLFTIGIHTEDHPQLSRCSFPEKERQLTANQAFLRSASAQPCDLVAYPEGDYDHETLELTRTMNLDAGFAVDVRIGASERYEIPRFGIYRNSVHDLAAKVQWGATIRRVGLAIS